jgi:lysophospholipase L1-like esterase
MSPVLSVLCGALLVASPAYSQVTPPTTTANVVTATTEPTIQVEGDLRKVTTAAYEAVVDAKGALPSFKVGGQEFLKAETGVPHGAYLYQTTPIWLPEIEQPEKNVLVAKSALASMRYEFSATGLTMTVENASEKGLTLYIVLDPAAGVFFNNSGKVTRTFASISGQTTTTWFADKNRLQIEGGNQLFGPWGKGYQVWSISVPAKEKRTVKMTGGQASAEELAKIANAPADTPPRADIAAPKTDDNGAIRTDFLKTHESYVQRAKQGNIDLLFVGDSITNRWRGVNTLWEQHFGKYNPANFGIEGDRTEHVLWRFENGELAGINPKVVVVMIGTNNMGYPTEEIIKGDKAVVADIQRRLPNTKVLLLGIFPRGAKPTDGARAKIKSINAELAKLDDGNKTRFLDIGTNLLEADGTLSAEIAPDSLHLSPKGYQIWADAMQPLLDEMMK